MSQIPVVLLFAIYLNIFFFRPVGPIPALLSLLGFMVFWLATHWHERVINKWSVLFGVTLVISHLIPIFIASKAVVAFVWWGATLLVPLFVLTSAIQPTRLIELCFAVYTGVKAYLASALLSVTRGSALRLSESVQQTKNSRLAKYLVGVLLSIPVVLLLVMLLSSDPIFYQRIKDIIPEDLLFEIPGRIGMSIFVSFLLIPAYHLIQKIREHRGSVVADMIGRFHAPEISLTMSGLVTLVLSIFIVVQWPYIFVRVARETDLHQYGVKTFSEYVTKGFVELIVASIVVLGVISLAIIVRNNIQKMTRAYSVINLLLIGCYSLLVVSCLRRVGLYVELHGLSVIRVYGSFVLIALLCVVPFILLRFVYKKTYLFAEVAVMCALFIFMLGTSADRLIATQYPPTVNKQVDFSYLARLSADGARGWEMALESVNSTLVTRNLQQKPLLDARDRQDIAKAALTLRYLKDGYAHLQDVYLGVDAYNQNRTLILKTHLEMYKDKLVYLKEKMKTNRDIESEYNTTLDLSNKINECLVKVEEKKNLECMKGFAVDQSYQGPYMGYQSLFYPVFKDLTYSPRPTYFYNIWVSDNAYDPLKQGYRAGYYPQWYSYNKIEKETFERFEKMQYAPRLLKLMAAYAVLEEKIISQPLNERDYEQDVSLEAPLL